MKSILKSIKNRISTNNINVLKISSGTIAGQLVSMLMIPLLTRLYGAGIIGAWSVLNSIAQVGYSASDLALTNALMIEKDEDKAEIIYQVVSSVSLLISVLVGVASIVYFLFTGTPQGMNGVFVIVYIMIAIFTLQQVQICYTCLNRDKKYNVLMKNPIINNSVFGGAAVLFVILGAKQYGYFLSWLIGQIVTIIHMRRHMPLKTFTLNKSNYAYVFSVYKRFTIYQLPANVIGNIKNQLPTFLIRNYFGEDILGYYTMTVKIMLVPITFLAQSIGKVFFQQIAEMKRKGQEIGEYVYKRITDAMRIGVIPLIIILGIGDVLTVLFLGKEWEMAGVFIRIMAVQNFFNFQMMSMSGITSVLGKQNYSLVFNVLQCIGVAVGLSVGHYVFNNVYVAIILMSMAFVVFLFIYFSLLFKSMDIKPQKYILFTGKYILVMFIGAIGLRSISFLFGLVNSII